MDHLNDAFAQITIPTPEAMEAFGGSLSTLLKEGDIIALSVNWGQGNRPLRAA
jgi:tRNA A37 threonylcarbamoyladenosine biosynthesis protein TsaE